MKTLSISNSYNIKWQFKKAEHICITDDKRILNTKTNQFLKKVVKGGYSVGYNIDGVFIPLSKINQEVELIKTQYYPFLTTKNK